jgi:tetratricopeptide (TPR) repeat protein
VRTVVPALILSLALAIPASACLNYYRKNIKGESIETDDAHADPTTLLRALTQHPEHDEIKSRDLGPEPAAGADFQVRNDYAANLIRQGKTRRAIDILESIEQSHPGEYIVAANLGTAYELNGDIDRAQRWISEGIQRYPNLHQGTEWLHLRILEAKRGLAKDPNWLQTHSVLDFDFGKDDVPKFPPVWGAMGEQRVLSALHYQLHERLAFVSPPDPIVGELLGVYADQTAVLWPVDYAIPLYDLALSFKPAHADVLGRRRARAMELRPSMFEDWEERDWGLLAAGVITIALVSLLGLRGYFRGRPRRA